MFKFNYTIKQEDLNYGNHVGNERALLFFQWARESFLRQNNLSESNIGDGSGFIQVEATVQYKKQLFYDIYFVDIDKLDNDIENFFKEISKLRNRGIVKILKNDFEIVMVCLNMGKIWEAFLKKDNKIYLNTELDVSIDVTDIVEKYYKKS